jgi:hypothetical protein
MAEVRTVCFDLDGVICTQTDGGYAHAQPIAGAIALINCLHDEGYRIIIHTARFMGRNHGDVIATYKAGYSFTVDQLAGWGVKYHDLYMGKPAYDVVIDDRSVFFRSDWDSIYRAIKDR